MDPVADGEDGSIALLSIHPEFVRQIVDGAKRVEFRRTSFARPVSHVVVYSTTPEKRLVGYFEVADVDKGTPMSLWLKHNRSSGISRERLFAYLEGGRQAVAIIMGAFYSFKKELSLEDIGVIAPPRSFRYLDREILPILKSCT